MLAADPADRAKPSTSSQPGIFSSERDAAALPDAPLSSPTQSNLLVSALCSVHVCVAVGLLLVLVTLLYRGVEPVVACFGVLMQAFHRLFAGIVMLLK